MVKKRKNLIVRLMQLSRGAWRRVFPNYTKDVLRQATACKGSLKVNGPSRVNGNTHLGHNVNFNGLLVSGNGKVVIGDNFHSGPECLIITDIHDYENGDAIPYGSTYISRDVHIEDNVWIGRRVIILGGVRIGEGAIIQAGSCVVSDIPKYGIAGGHPAKVFKRRNIEHYETLKAEGRFH